MLKPVPDGAQIPHAPPLAEASTPGPERAWTFPAKTHRPPSSAKSHRREIPPLPGASHDPHQRQFDRAHPRATAGGADAFWPNAPVRPAPQTPVTGAQTHRSATPVGKTAENALPTHNGTGRPARDHGRSRTVSGTVWQYHTERVIYG